MRAKTPAEIEIMREGGKKLAQTLQKLAVKVQPDITPRELANIAEEEVKKAGLRPILKGYEGFPAVMCISINDAIVHGMPGKKPIKEGDVVNLDLTVGYKNLILDSAISVYAGKNPPADIKRLLEGTKRALEAGIRAIKGDGTRVGDISAAIQNTLDGYNLGVIRDLVGHAVGDKIHEEPSIPNYGVAGTGPVLPAGVTIAVEPMASLGDWHIDTANDDWTVIMRDGSIGAHFEHTVLVTEDGAEVLTAI
ncbi:type I methionyl aminopeptidase [Candidatus Saccharibacteria bacterium]|nr:type I methionyl aminopeptidase [Candidatus Saccharibacteria bacterium]